MLNLIFDMSAVCKYETFRREVREFCLKELAPRVDEFETKDEFPLELIPRLAQRAYLGVPYPKELGGAGLDYVSYAIVAEEVSRVWGSLGLTVCAHISLGTFPIYRFAAEAVRQRLVPKLASGEMLGAFGLTEPNAGSDAAGIETRASKTGDGYALNGTKRFITSAEYAGTVVVAATLDRSLGAKGISCFLVETGTPGYTIGNREHKLGLLASNTVELIFENCRIPRENLLGKEYQGYAIFMETLDGGRISIGAHAVGLAQGALDAVLAWAQAHPTKSQMFSKALADMATRIHAARLMVYDAARLKDAGIRNDRECAMAKLYGSETATWAAGEAVRLLGYFGLTKEYPVERIFRDTKLSEIGEGTSEVMRLIIAKEVLKG
jgi:alkylation response protein AidB-like acyl-CoA dehydrogenase